jgi:RNA polymerase sigma factor (sigma-70 family)
MFPAICPQIYGFFSRLEREKRCAVETENATSINLLEILLTLVPFLRLICEGGQTRRRENKMTEQEFGHIARENEARLKALARRFSRAADVAIDEEDVIQEALLAFWSLSEKGYPVHNAEALLTKITKNICVSHYRKRHVETQAIVNEDFPGGISANGEVDRQDAERLRNELYGSLTPSEREYTSLREQTGWSLDEMSAATGKDKSTIKALLSKARHKMKQIIRNQ